MSAAKIVTRVAGSLTLVAFAGCCVSAMVAAGGNGAARPASGATSLTYAAYAWNAGDVVSRWKAGTLWSLAKTTDVDTFMLGFTDADIAKYSRKNGADEMNAMIGEGKRRGLKFELLLGDPSWIVPKGVPALERILRRLRGVRFAGANLDLEPNEVRGVPLKTAMTDLVKAMRRYVSVSPWPVTLDANWIYMNGGAKFNGGYCFPCGLEAAKVERIALLVYVGNPKTVRAIAAPILERYPSLTFTVGQSVEPPSVLPERDSYWHDGFQKFYADMRRLDAKMRALPNYAGLDVESLQYLETMPL